MMPFLLNEWIMIGTASSIGTNKDPRDPLRRTTHLLPIGDFSHFPSLSEGGFLVSGLNFSKAFSEVMFSLLFSHIHGARIPIRPCDHLSLEFLKLIHRLAGICSIYVGIRVRSYVLDDQEIASLISFGSELTLGTKSAGLLNYVPTLWVE